MRPDVAAKGQKLSKKSHTYEYPPWETDDSMLLNCSALLNKTRRKPVHTDTVCRAYAEIRRKPTNILEEKVSVGQDEQTVDLPSGLSPNLRCFEQRKYSTVCQMQSSWKHDRCLLNNSEARRWKCDDVRMLQQWENGWSASCVRHSQSV